VASALIDVVGQEAVDSLISAEMATGRDFYFSIYMSISASTLIRLNYSPTLFSSPSNIVMGVKVTTEV